MSIHLNNTRDWSTFEGVKIFKIHGDLEHTPMILTQQDYLDYEKDHPAAFHLLQSLFYTRTILFIGCSLADQILDVRILGFYQILPEVNLDIMHYFKNQRSRI